MKVFSVATDRVAFLSSLEDSARRFGYDLHVLGRDQKWQGFLWRWTLVLDAVEALDPDEVVSVETLRLGLRSDTLLHVHDKS